jgi:hypothetical protein
MVLQGTVQQQQALLQLKLAQAIAGNRYELQSSLNGSNFSAVQTQTGAAGQLSLQFTDATLGSGQKAYRIKQTDANGAVSYSNIVLLSGNGAQGAITAYPNPVKAGGLLQLSSNGQTIKGWQLVNAQGQTVLQQRSAASGSTYIQLPQHLTPGLYHLRLQSSEGSRQIKVMVE